MEKRIVVEHASGLRQIIGYMSIEPTDQFPQRFENVRLTPETIGAVAFKEARPRYILYHEIPTDVPVL